MSCRRLVFAAAHRVVLETGPLPRPGAGELLVRTRLSAISAGTEMLVFQGLFPEGLAVDAAIPALGAGPFAYPLAYGYSCVGQVTAAGEGVGPGWMDRRVFAFQPHRSHFVCRPQDLLPLPEGLGPEDAVFLAAMETAVNLVMDGRPVVGERAVVVGLGMTGLLTLGLLARHPLSGLVGVDRLARRREAARTLGATAALAGAGPPGGGPGEGPDDRRADLVYELTGQPEALDTALGFTGYGSRVVIGSWYGARRATVDLGGRFHRDRIQLVSSQVSTLAPVFSGRWTKARRMAVAWEMLARLRPGRFITHRFPVEEAQQAYLQVARKPEETLQVVLTYDA